MRRRWSRASGLYLAGSVLSALVAGMVLQAYVPRVAAAAGAGGPEVTVVVATRSIARGATVRAGGLRAISMPKAYAPPGSFSSIAEAAGRVALGDLAAGEVVTKTRLARVRAGPVASLIPAGLRAFAVPTSLPPGAVGDGDLVDVLATYGATGGGQPHTESVVSGVEVLFVLGASGFGSSPGGDPEGPDVTASDVERSVTLILLVSPDQETRLAFARAFANLEVVIAPPGINLTA
jgi:Flp pilus assembly protein CpaB